MLKGHGLGCGCLSRRRLLQGGAALGGAALLTGCEENALGRDSLQLFSDSDLEAAAGGAWNNIVRTAPRSGNASFNERVQRVGADMARVSGVGGTPEFLVIEDPSPNALVLPGAKVGVHSGLFSVVASDDELAAVLGHEMGHVVAKHANERASQQTLTDLTIGLLTNQGQDARLARALGLGAELVVLLPYSRNHELESDRLGVRYAHAAGYDPHGAVSLWTKMGQLGGGAPDFLSTHPGAENRIEVIRSEIAAL